MHRYSRMLAGGKWCLMEKCSVPNIGIIKKKREIWACVKCVEGFSALCILLGRRGPPGTSFAMWMANNGIFVWGIKAPMSPQQLLNTARKRNSSPVLLLQLGEQLHIVRAQLRRRGWREGWRGQRRGGRGSGGGLQGCGRGHLASHLTDRVGHWVLHPWESRTQLASNLVCRHLQGMDRQDVSVQLKAKKKKSEVKKVKSEALESPTGIAWIKAIDTFFLTCCHSKSYWNLQLDSVSPPCMQKKKQGYGTSPAANRHVISFLQFISSFEKTPLTWSTASDPGVLFKACLK